MDLVHQFPTTFTSRRRNDSDADYPRQVFGSRAKGKTSDAINKLLNLAPKTATILRNGVESIIPIEEVEKDDILIVKAGESIPVDGILTDGTAPLMNRP